MRKVIRCKNMRLVMQLILVPLFWIIAGTPGLWAEGQKLDASKLDISGNTKSSSVDTAYITGSSEPSVPMDVDQSSEYLTKAEYKQYWTDAEAKMVYLVLSPEAYLPEVTILKNTDGIIHFRYRNSKTVYKIKVDEVKTVVPLPPSPRCFAIKPGELVRRNIVNEVEDANYPDYTKLPKKIVSKVLLASDNEVEDENSYSGTTQTGNVENLGTDFREPYAAPAKRTPQSWEDVEMNMVCLVFKNRRFFIRDVLVLAEHDGTIFFRVQREEPVYRISKNKVFNIARTINENDYFFGKHSRFLQDKFILLEQKVYFAELPKIRSKLKGVTRKIKDIFSLEPVGFLVGAGTLEFEHFINNNTAIAVGFCCSYPGGKTFSGVGGANGPEHQELGGQVSARVYPLADYYAPAGLWIGPCFKYYVETFPQYSKSLTYFNSLLEVGWGFSFEGKHSFVVSPFIGVGFSAAGGPVYAGEGGPKIAPRAVTNEGLTGLIGCNIGIGL